MTMDIETHNKLIEQYLDNAEAEFDHIVERGERKRLVRWSLAAVAAAACVALVLWLATVHTSADGMLTPIQIAEGIQQMMLLDIGDIESIEATPSDSYAILTAYLKDGSTCTYILQCNDAEGTTTLFAYSSN